MIRLSVVSRAALLLAALAYAGCTNSPRKDVGATAVGTGVGVVVCAVTLIFCPAVVAVGAGGAFLVRKYNVSHDSHARDAAVEQRGRRGRRPVGAR